MSGHHDHHNVRGESKQKLLTVAGITATFMVIEVITGLMTGSLALLADAGHMLSDLGGILLGLLAIWFSSKPATPGKTFGYYRSEILAGFFNALTLVAISVYIIFEAYRRFFHPEPVSAGPVLAVALLGLCMNLVSLKLLHNSAQKSINTKAAYLELLGDSLASVGVVISSIVIMVTKWYQADPIISGLIGIAIIPRTWMLLMECINILMEGTPGHINLGKLRESILSVEGVLDVHDIHVWTITSGLDSMSAHVAIDQNAPSEVVLTQVTKILNDEYSLSHTTIQVEPVECRTPGQTACHSWDGNAVGAASRSNGNHVSGGKHEHAPHDHASHDHDH